MREREVRGDCFGSIGGDTLVLDSRLQRLLKKKGVRFGQREWRRWGM
jgi:hypothetical protein